MVVAEIVRQRLHKQPLADLQFFCNALWGERADRCNGQEGAPGRRRANRNARLVSFLSKELPLDIPHWVNWAGQNTRIKGLLTDLPAC